MDIDSNAIVLRGLSMPHSPRWYQGKLWFLESGQGSLALADPERGSWQTVAQVPGFTRGLDFYGPLAFIGLSQVRESAIFSGIPLVERLRDRICGVWVVDIESGETLGFLRFEAGVQEIFAVQVLAGIQFPELLEWNDERLGNSYVLPDEALAEVKLPTPAELEQSAAFHFQRATTLYHEAKLTEAIAAYRECVRLDPTFPNARYNLGVALGDAEELDEARACLQAVIEAEPERAEAYNSFGYLTTRGPARRGDRLLRTGGGARADYAQAHFNLGMSLLQLGDYPRGFAEYAWRWRTGQFTPFLCPHPKWHGAPIPEQTLLIHTEQGAGDAIQFARYLPLVAERCRKLMLVCRANLMPLLATLPGIAEVREPGTLQVAEFDTYLPLLSLPEVFGTTEDRNCPEHRAVLRSRNAAPASGGTRADPARAAPMKIGIVWAGSPTYQNDRHRSCRLSAFMPMLGIPGIDFFSLQKGEPSRELTELMPGLALHDLDAAMRDFGDTALLYRAIGSRHQRRYRRRSFSGRLGQAGLGALARRARLALGTPQGTPPPGTRVCGSFDRPKPGTGPRSWRVSPRRFPSVDAAIT